jgi:hypothetical protein
MIRQEINLGTAPNNKTGDSARVGGQKMNANFEYLFSIALPVKNDQKYLLAKGYGNTAETNEVGDLFMYWESSTKFVEQARWEGGTDYTVIEATEFNNE